MFLVQANRSCQQFTFWQEDLTGEVLFCAGREILRNAAKHGRGSQPNRPLHVRVSAIAQAGLLLSIEDDGVGLSLPETTEKEGPGGGRGLMLHSAMLAIIGGALNIDSRAGEYSRVSLTLPETTLQRFD